MHRRQFLASCAWVLSLGPLSATAAADAARVTIPLWPGQPPGGGGPQGARKISARGAVSHIAIPILTMLRPENPDGRAVLIAADGGYRRIEMAKEAWPAARWLARRGYTPTF